MLLLCLFLNFCSYFFNSCLLPLLLYCSSFGFSLSSLLNFFNLPFFLCSLLISFCFNCFLSLCFNFFYLLLAFFTIFYFFKELFLEIFSIFYNSSDCPRSFLFFRSNQAKLFKKNLSPLRSSKVNKVILRSFRYCLIFFLIFYIF